MFFGISALVFAASAVVTVVWCGSMSSMPGMEMPGGWTMSMAWMRMPGQTWFGTAATFMGMWIVMMIAMMLPAVMPMLTRYRRAVRGASGARITHLTTVVGAGYFGVWTLCGVAAFLLGIALAQIAMRVPGVSRALPLATGFVVVAAGLLQFSPWKTQRLACCRNAPAQSLPTDAIAAWHHGLRLGLHCVHCCAGLTAVLLAVGVMDLRAMTFATAAITAERLAPAGERVAGIIGAALVVAGLFLIAESLLAYAL
jgi:predicted metal-binding membrane protein